MKRSWGIPFIAIVTLMALSVAHAVHDSGVEKSVDEFTGAGRCRQLVAHDGLDWTGVILARLTGDVEAVLVHVFRSAALNAPTFSNSGVLSGDKVYIRFPASGEVVEFEPALVKVESINESAGFVVDFGFLDKLLSAPSGIRVRFFGSGGNRDFSISHDVILALAAGFGAECL